MGQKLKIAGWICLGAITGALTTVQLQAVARNNFSPLPLEELQQLAAVFSMLAGMNIFIVRAPDFPIEFIVLGIWMILGLTVWWIASPARRATTNEERSKLMLLR